MEEYMTHINKTVSGTMIILTLFLFIFFAGTGVIVSAEEIEETSEITLYNDTTLIGKMNEISRRSIIVDDIRYTLCDNIIIFSPHDTRVSLNNMDAAKEVQLFINDNCVRKINVMRFAE